MPKLELLEKLPIEFVQQLYGLYFCESCEWRGYFPRLYKDSTGKAWTICKSCENYFLDQQRQPGAFLKVQDLEKNLERWKEAQSKDIVYKVKRRMNIK
jgi:hypothetical protein